MKAEREKWSGRVTATALRFQTGQYELAEEEEICRIILVSGGSFTLVRGGESLLVNPGCVLLLGPGGGLLQQAGHIAPELIGCRFPAGVLPVLKNLMQRDFMPLFEPGAQTALYGPVQWSGRLRTLLGMMQSAENEPESPGMIYLALILHYVEQECRSERQDIRPRNETVEQICAYLAANYQQKFSLTDVAARFYLSPYYLSRLFRRVTGQSIVDYINAAALRLPSVCWRAPT